jgi:hypothetical protein
MRTFWQIAPIITVRGPATADLAPERRGRSVPRWP